MGPPASGRKNPGLPGHSTGWPSETCPALARWLSCGGPRGRGSSQPSRCLGGKEGGENHPEPQQLDGTALCRLPTTSATSRASSETGRFPVVAAPFPSATLYCKQRATLKKALRCPVSGGGREADCHASLEGNIPAQDPLKTVLLPPPGPRSHWKKRSMQASLGDLRWASSEWQLGLLHAV